MPTLTVNSGPAAGQVLEIRGEVVLGRGEVDLVIEDPELSRRHVAIRSTEAGVTVEDLGSRNGTWVNGRRIGGSVLLTESGVLRVGTSELRIELPASDATRVREVPHADTARRTPGQTVERPRRAEPDRVSSLPPVAPPPVAPPPAPASAPADGAPQERSPRPSLRARLPILVAAVVATALVIALVLAQTGGSSTERKLSATLTLATVTQSANTALLTGVQSGAPTGTGTATIDEVFQQPQAQAQGNATSTPVSGKLISRFDNGSITSILTLTATVQADRSTRFTGRAKVSNGTGDYDGVTGSFRYTATQAPRANAVTATLKGTLKY